MGNAKKSYIRIEFKKYYPEAFKSATSFQEALVKYFLKTYDAVAEPDITIIDFEAFDNEVQLEFYSTRGPHLDFQINLLNEFLEAEYSGLVEEVNEDTWTQS